MLPPSAPPPAPPICVHLRIKTSDLGVNFQDTLRTLVATLVSAPSRRVDVSANDEWFADGETTVVRVVLMQPTAEDAVEGDGWRTAEHLQQLLHTAVYSDTGELPVVDSLNDDVNRYAALLDTALGAPVCADPPPLVPPATRGRRQGRGAHPSAGGPFLELK